ncbi:MAG TPA: imidazole glycerol phosphate synthase subunit HisH [Porphyromonadaceae bacterium]|nr:imidazole glycerol phosphate synthase subunit HisH [Porphyromonadaceae bacterium]
MRIAIINHCGNIRSVDCALHRLGIDPILTTDQHLLEQMDKIIFPGQGEASSTMEYLHKTRLDLFIKSWKKPIMGICIGLQLMCKHSEEGDVEGLSIFNSEVKRFPVDNLDFKIPHMGWNTLSSINSPFLPKEIEGKYVYYVHSYYASLCEDTVAKTEYIVPFSAALQKGNFYATQFHPEKSGDIGERVLQEWIEKS